MKGRRIERVVLRETSEIRETRARRRDEIGEAGGLGVEHWALSRLDEIFETTSILGWRTRLADEIREIWGGPICLISVQAPVPAHRC